MATLTEYRGFRIEQYSGRQIGHKLPNSNNLLARLGIGTARNYDGLELFYPDSQSSKIVKNMKEARSYIDNYLA